MWTKNGGHVLGGPVRVFPTHSVPPPLSFLFDREPERVLHTCIDPSPHTHCLSELAQALLNSVSFTTENRLLRRYIRIYTYIDDILR